MKLLCIKCFRPVATAKDVNGIITWFAICSECLYGVKCWKASDFKKIEKCIAIREKGVEHEQVSEKED